MAVKKASNKEKVVPNALPYVQAAALCENVLEDKDGMLSAIRIFDRLTLPDPIQKPAGHSPDATPAVMVKILVILKSGSVKGKRTVKIVYVCPGGESGQAAEAACVFEGGEQGVQIQAFIAIPVTGEGLYWCSVRVNDREVTRIPLRLVSAEPVEQDKTAPKVS